MHCRADPFYPAPQLSPIAHGHSTPGTLGTHPLDDDFEANMLCQFGSARVPGLDRWNVGDTIAFRSRSIRESDNNEILSL